MAVPILIFLIALALVALQVYEIVRQLDAAGVVGSGGSKPDIVATGLVDMLGDVGPILGVGAITYLLATQLTAKEFD